MMIGPEKIIEKKRAYLYPCAQHFYQTPPQIVRGQMQYLYDHEGRQYLDFYAGVSVMNCGHCNPDIVDVAIQQMKTLQHTTTIYLTQPMVDLAERLAGILPGALKRSFFCTSGTEANEGAMLLARLHTGKRDFIAIENGLHGRTHLTMNVTAIPMWRTDPYLGDHVHMAKGMGHGHGTLEERARDCLEDIRGILASHDSIAALIMEPIQGNGGIITPPDWFFKELKALLHDHGVLFIADEVQTGFARTGKMFAMDTYGVVPDIMTMAKALGNGMPISAFATTDTIAASFTKPSASTLGGNPVAAKTAMAVIDYIEEHQLCERSERLGQQLKTGLKTMAKDLPFAVEVRGKGLMIGMELADTATYDKAALTDKILEDMKDRGFIIGKNGLERNVLAFQPPLIITEENITDMLKALKEVCDVYK